MHKILKILFIILTSSSLLKSAQYSPEAVATRIISAAVERIGVRDNSTIPTCDVYEMASRLMWDMKVYMRFTSQKSLAQAIKQSLVQKMDLAEIPFEFLTRRYPSRAVMHDSCKVSTPFVKRFAFKDGCDYELFMPFLSKIALIENPNVKEILTNIIIVTILGYAKAQHHMTKMHTIIPKL